MTVATAKLTSKYQITIPAEVRQRLHLKAGDLVYLAIENDQVHLRSVPESWTSSTRGLGAEMWRRAGGVRAIEEERDAWDDE